MSARNVLRTVLALMTSLLVFVLTVALLNGVGGFIGVDTSSETGRNLVATGQIATLVVGIYAAVKVFRRIRRGKKNDA